MPGRPVRRFHRRARAPGPPSPVGLRRPESPGAERVWMSGRQPSRCRPSGAGRCPRASRCPRAGRSRRRRARLRRVARCPGPTRRSGAGPPRPPRGVGQGTALRFGGGGPGGVRKQHGRKPRPRPRNQPYRCDVESRPPGSRPERPPSNHPAHSAQADRSGPRPCACGRCRWIKGRGPSGRPHRRRTSRRPNEAHRRRHRRCRRSGGGGPAAGRPVSRRARRAPARPPPSRYRRRQPRGRRKVLRTG